MKLKDFKKSPSLMLLEDKGLENGAYSTEKKFIDVKKVRYDKKILIIYNPNSGKKTNVRL